MNDSKFWRCIVVVLAVALFYIGHGLHETNSISLPELTTTAVAGDVAVFATDDKAAHRIVTSNDDGTVIYLWHIRQGGNQVEFYAKSAAQ